MKLKYQVRLEGTSGRGNGKLLAAFATYEDAREYSYGVNCNSQPELQDALVVTVRSTKKK